MTNPHAIRNANLSEKALAEAKAAALTMPPAFVRVIYPDIYREVKGNIMKITIKKEVEARFLKVNAAVRYEDEDMPFDAPKREGNDWIATIDLKEQCVVSWPQGETLSFYMKVCDEGIYTLLAEDGTELAKIEGYVPNKLLPGDYGDYLALKIDANGKITNWLSYADLSDFEEDE